MYTVGELLLFVNVQCLNVYFLCERKLNGFLGHKSKSKKKENLFFKLYITKNFMYMQENVIVQFHSLYMNKQCCVKRKEKV